MLKTPKIYKILRKFGQINCHDNSADWSTKVKFLEKPIFAIFDSNQEHICPISSFKYGISSYVGLKFPLRCLYNHYFIYALKCIYHVSYEI